MKMAFAPWLSNNMKKWICEMLRKGFTPQQVLQHHIEPFQKTSFEGTFWTTRDTFLTMQDIVNLANKSE